MPLTIGSNPYTTLSHELMHQRPYVTFYADQVRMNGLEKDYSYIETSGGVSIVALTKDHKVALVGQWRYPIKKYTWELPAGSREKGEDPLETGRRELKEEAGASASKWTELGIYFMEGSKSTQKSYLFLAEDVELGESNPMEDECLENLWLPLEEALQLVELGEIDDAISVIGLLRAQAHLQK